MKTSIKLVVVVLLSGVLFASDAAQEQGGVTQTPFTINRRIHRSRPDTHLVKRRIHQPQHQWEKMAEKQRKRFLKKMDTVEPTEEFTNKVIEHHAELQQGYSLDQQTARKNAEM